MSEPSTGIELQDRALTELRGMYDPDLDFKKLLLETKAGYVARGFRLVDKDDLIGIPHNIIGVTYRNTEYIIPGTKIHTDYVSCETVVADAETFNLPQVRSMIGDNQILVWPNETVVYNDGGKGVRRELTKTLHRTGQIDVGGDFDQDGESIYDRPLELWADGADFAQSGITVDADGEAFRYLAIRGLRRSDYDSPYGPATTFYFA